MKIFCIDVGKFNKIEIEAIITQFSLESLRNELHRMKIDGYYKVYFEKGTQQLMFYTLNNSKTTLQIGEYLKSGLGDMKSIGISTATSFYTRIGECMENNLFADMFKVKANNAPIDSEDYEMEMDRILDKINTEGIASLTLAEMHFMNTYSVARIKK